MIACPSCGAENPERARFCMECAGPLSATRPITEERKVVTSLFCDLVSFTVHSEAADHELIDALLQDYGALAASLVHSCGGVVEKYIGDAVVATFGFPASHDDDAERALRCAFRLVEQVSTLMWPDGDPVQLRIGINSGETYVHTDVDPASGRGFLTGDAVNTAARLETAAPPAGIVVGMLTHELTRHVVAYVKLEPLTVKGKSEPVRAWLAQATNEGASRTGIRTSGRADTLFVGRDRELEGLHATFEQVLAFQEAQYVLIVGEPGIGKSRLVLEFARAFSEAGDVVTWRQGRCLAYGDGSGFAALSEILKGHAGILDSDDARTVESKLEAVVSGGEDRVWLCQRLRPLLGLEAAEAPQDENFAAWIRYIHSLALSGPAVVVLEDLHWAGEAMLAFVERLTEQFVRAPLLVVATARPELIQRHPDLLAAGNHTSRLPVSPLARRDSSRLISALLDHRLAAALRTPIVERCGGNPLYAEEYVRLLIDRGLLLEAQGLLRLTEGMELPLPDTVQAVLAARLDSLPPEQKALLCDAAVFGESFWCGGVAAIAQRPLGEVERTMTALAERQLVRPAVASSLAGEVEYLFWHALARDVAYGELPRRVRVSKHERTAAWIQDKAGQRADDFAEILAHHYVTALELATALRDEALVAPLVEPALTTSLTAGSRARELDAKAAERLLAKALELAPPEASQRPRLLAQWAMVLSDVGRCHESLPAFEEALAALKSMGDPTYTAMVMTEMAIVLERLGRPECRALAGDALALLEGEQPSVEMVYMLHMHAVDEMNLGRPEHAKELADEALAIAVQLGLPQQGHHALRAYQGALMARGDARFALGDLGGLDDMKQASEDALAKGSGPIPVLNYAGTLAQAKGPLATLPVHEECLRLCASHGLRRAEVETRGGLFEAWCAGGFWKEALAAAGSLIAETVDTENMLTLVQVEAWLGLLLSKRGEPDLALPHAESSLRRARGQEVPALLTLALTAAATAHADADRSVARALVQELPDTVDRGFAFSGIYQLPQMLRIAHLVGTTELAERLTSWLEPRTAAQCLARTYGDALLAEAHGEHRLAVSGFAHAAAGWHDFGVPYEEGQALLGQGRCLAALGRAPEAAAPLAAAREIFARLGAMPALAETDELIEKAASA